MERLIQRAFWALLLAVLLAVPLGTALRSRNRTADDFENRALAEFPVLTMEALWDGGFGTALESWYSDHVPGRATLLRADTAVQMKLRPVVNGAVLGQEVLLPFIDYGNAPEEELAQKAAAIGERWEALLADIRAQGGQLLFVGIPEQRNYFAEAFPQGFNSGGAGTADTVFRLELERRGVPFLDMGQVYEEQGHPTHYYSSVDHHYTYYGAYAAYRAILDRLETMSWTLPVLTEEEIDFVELPNPCLGSRNRKLYDLWPNQERMVLGVQRDPVVFRRWDWGAPSETPLFVLPEAWEYASYTVYMGGDFSETILRTDRPELPNALIFGDSFTNALETLLYASFNETRSLDLRHYQEKSLGEYLAEYQPDLVICVMNDTFYYEPDGNNRVWVP